MYLALICDLINLGGTRPMFSNHQFGGLLSDSPKTMVRYIRWIKSFCAGVNGASSFKPIAFRERL
jgi:hypothetical protein